MIRALIVDDHPAVVSGLVSAFRAEPGVIPLGTASGASAALTRAKRVQPNVALVDFHLSDGDGLTLCHELKLLASPPGVLIYSAFAQDDLALAATVAGVDGIVDKGAPLDDLFTALRTVARGGKVLPPLRPEAIERIVPRLEREDLTILGMRMDGATLSEISAALQLGERELSRRLTALLRLITDPARPATGR